MIAQAILEDIPSLPAEANFNAPLDGPTVIFVSGSVWSSAAGAQVGVNLSLDGTFIGRGQIYCNESSSHQAFIPMLLSVNLTAGQHTISAQALNAQTMFDVNDYLYVALLY